jgi:iron(III) transport system permease protein
MKIGTLESFPAQRKRLFESFDGRTLLLSAFLALVAFLVFTPLLFLLYASFETVSPDGTTVYTLQGWRQALDNPGIVTSIYNSFSLAVARQSIATVIGILLAWLIARTDVPLRGWLELSFWISYFIPSLPVALGWILLLDPKYGLINDWLASLPFINGPLFNVYSFWGIVWVHLSASTIAIKVMLLTPAFRNLDAALEEASHVAGAGSLKTLLRIAAPIMMPTILVALILGLIRSLEAFEIELILGRPVGLHVFSTKIYGFMTVEPPQFAPASALGSFFLIVLGSLVVFQRFFLKDKSYTTPGRRFFGAGKNCRRHRRDLLQLRVIHEGGVAGETSSIIQGGHVRFGRERRAGRSEESSAPKRGKSICELAFEQRRPAALQQSFWPGDAPAGRRYDVDA